MELLAIDDLPRAHTKSKRALDLNGNSEEEEYVEENLSSRYAQGLIDGVLANLKEHEFKKKRRRLDK